MHRLKSAACKIHVQATTPQPAFSVLFSRTSKLIMQVHDELVLEVPEDEVTIVQERLPMLMTDVATLRVALVVDLGVGRNWEEAH